MEVISKKNIKPLVIPLVRTVDDLGRIIIPAEMRRALNINVGDKLNVYMTKKGVYMEVMDDSQEYEEY